MIFNETKISLNEPLSNKIALIDGDSILYALASETEEFIQEGYVFEDYALKDALEALKLRIQHIKERTGCLDAEIYISGNRQSNFRYQVDPNYKVNRKIQAKPIYLEPIRELVSSSFSNVHKVDTAEPDDAVVTLYTQNPRRYYLCAIDKDILNSCVGRHYNYKKDTFVETDYMRAYTWAYEQALSGDYSDGIKGCPGMGPKKAEKWMNSLIKEYGARLTEQDMWNELVKMYQTHFKNKEEASVEALKNMRLVNMYQLQNDLQTIKLYEIPT